MTTADVIESREAIAIKVPAKVRVLEADPLPVTTSALTRVPESRKINPRVANFRAAVVEKKVTKRTSAIGLMHHHGSEPGPPGFAKNAKFGPPPGRLSPISESKRLGLINTASDPGAESRIGSKRMVEQKLVRDKLKSKQKKYSKTLILSFFDNNNSIRICS